jgi:hypothetical protein
MLFPFFANGQNSNPDILYLPGECEGKKISGHAKLFGEDDLMHMVWGK